MRWSGSLVCVCVDKQGVSSILAQLFLLGWGKKKRNVKASGIALWLLADLFASEDLPPFSSAF
jgi:hypothetical protein